MAGRKGKLKGGPAQLRTKRKDIKEAGVTNPGGLAARIAQQRAASAAKGRPANPGAPGEAARQAAKPQWVQRAQQNNLAPKSYRAATPPRMNQPRVMTGPAPKPAPTIRKAAPAAPRSFNPTPKSAPSSSTSSPRSFNPTPKMIDTSPSASPRPISVPKPKTTVRRATIR